MFKNVMATEFVYNIYFKSWE